jgi:hypothetical protein
MIDMSENKLRLCFRGSTNLSLTLINYKSSMVTECLILDQDNEYRKFEYFATIIVYFWVSQFCEFMLEVKLKKKKEKKKYKQNN